MSYDLPMTDREELDALGEQVTRLNQRMDALSEGLSTIEHRLANLDNFVRQLDRAVTKRLDEHREIENQKQAIRAKWGHLT